MAIKDLLKRIGGGATSLNDSISGALFSGGDPNDPAVAAARKNAMLQLGLGLAAGSSKGSGMSGWQAGLGALQGAQGGFGQQMAYMDQAARGKRKEEREDRALSNEEYRTTVQDRQHSEEQAMQRQIAQSSMEDRDLDRDQRREQFKQELGLRRQGMGQDLSLAERRLALEGERMRAGGPPPAGYRRTETGDLAFIPGGPADPARLNKDGKLSGEEQKAVSLSTRMAGAEQKIQKLAYTPGIAGGVYDRASSKLPGIGNVVTGKKYREHEQAAREWISGVLRLDSGAAVPETEFERYYATYFAMPGDPPEVISQKAESRARAMEGISGAMNETARSRIQTPSGMEQGFGQGTISKSLGGKKYVNVGGKWFIDE